MPNDCVDRSLEASSLMNRVVRVLIAALVAGTAVHVAFAPSASAAPVSSATDRQERVLAERDGIVVSVVSFRLPLAADAPPHPGECDRTGFLRYRPADGPADSRDADHVVVQEFL